MPALGRLREEIKGQPGIHSEALCQNKKEFWFYQSIAV
jgi:hypothetical protein